MGRDADFLNYTISGIGTIGADIGPIWADRLIPPLGSTLSLGRAECGAVDLAKRK